MRALATAAEASALDVRIQSEWHLPSILLMEGAAVRMWQSLSTLAQEDGVLQGKNDEGDSSLIIALAGPGNNGGDALALLRQARFSGRQGLAAILVTRKLGEATRLQYDALVAMGIPVLVFDEDEAGSRALLARAALIVDGIAGTGLREPLRPASSALVLAASAAKAAVAAIDLPSGLRDGFSPADAVLKATWTLSIEPRKLSLYYPAARTLAGRVVAIDGVFPPSSFSGLAARLLEAEDLSSLLPSLSLDAHKGRRGKVGVLAGSRGMVGAASLAIHGAFAGGAGHVWLYADKDLYPVFSAVASPEAFASAIIKPLPDRGDISCLGGDALVIGPGWGQEDAKASLIPAILERAIPAVVDADGLRLAAPLFSKGFHAQAPLVLTPHPGEFEALSGISPKDSLANPLSCLGAFAASSGAVIVLKSHVTWIASPDGRISVWDGREPSLAVAGSGDVLAGLAGAFLAGRLAAHLEGSPVDHAFAAAQAAVIAHGMAGRRARRKLGWFEAKSIAEEAARCLDPPSAFL